MVKQYFFLEEIIEQTGEWIVLNLVQSKSSCDICRFGLFSIVTIVKEYFRYWNSYLRNKARPNTASRYLRTQPNCVRHEEETAGLLRDSMPVSAIKKRGQNFLKNIFSIEA
ncbi:unnamed protein product [Rhizophagus irregularis]|nr:unnamed protein product [Rhizophagus irregularis]